MMKRPEAKGAAPAAAPAGPGPTPRLGDHSSYRYSAQIWALH
jgi:hypothetical protein